LVRKIERDQNRFRQIVRGKIKADLKKYITHGEMIGKTGGELVSIPMPSIDLPEFRYGSKGSGGVGQGPGDVGQPIGRSGEGEEGAGEAGDRPGQHILEVELTMDELAQILGEELELPRIQPKGQANIIEEKDKYTGIRQAGPESLRHFKRTYKKALRRQIASNTYNPDDPIVIPVREDKLYRSWNPIYLPQTNAVVLYLMDVSGSMTDDQKEIVRIEAFWIDTWLRSQYDGVTTRYIIHDAAAREVDEHTFYHTRESGGTRISSAYRLAHKIIEAEHPPADWNIYVLHFSDGDNWGEDNRHCVELLRNGLLPKCNLFGYGQVESPYGSGEFIRELEDAFESEPNLALSEIRDKEGIYDSIKEFLGRGR
jgi:sporulation protein YhbH